MEIDPRMSMLKVGASGSGKSSELWAFLKGLVEAGIPFRLRVFDPKGGTELRELEEVAYHYERLPARWSRFIGFAARGLEHRQHEMRQLGIRNVDLFDTRFPLEVMVIDELMTVLTMSSTGDMQMFGDTVKIRDALPTYLSQIRSANAMVFALSQSAEKNTLEAARDLFTYVSCLRVPQQATTTVDMLFGAGAHNAYPAHELIPATREAPHDAGIGWCRVEKEGVVMYRGGWLSDAERLDVAAQIGRATAQYRGRAAGEPDLSETSGAGGAATRRRAPRGSKTRTGRPAGAGRAAKMGPDGPHSGPHSGPQNGPQNAGGGDGA